MKVMKWAVLAAISVLGIAVAPGIVSAENATITGVASDCRDEAGAFIISWTLETSDTPEDIELDGFDDAGFAGFGPYFETIDDGVIDVVDGAVAPSLTLDDFGLGADGIHGNGSASAETSYDGSMEPNETIYAEGRVQWSSTAGAFSTDEQSIQSNDVARPDYCIEVSCLNGDYQGQAVNVLVDTNNCDPVRICLDGESMTVTEFAADGLDGFENGSCVPFEPGALVEVLGITSDAPGNFQVCTVDGVNYIIVENALLCSGKHQPLD